MLSKRIDCKKCLMPFDEEFINYSGECVLCQEHRKKWMYKDYSKSEKELIKIFDHYKMRNKNMQYDALVAFSGGKDSVYALYLAKNIYGLRPLAVTGDNGFLTEKAINNQKIIVDKLGVDHFTLNNDHEELQKLYRAYFRKTKSFCEICYMTILSSLGQAALKYDVPLIITGAAFKVDSSHFRAKYRYCFEDAFENIVKDKIPIEIYCKYITKNLRASNPLHILHIFDYVDHIEKDIYNLLENKLGWDSNNKMDHHMDCKFHDILGYIKWVNNDLTSLVFMAPASLLRDGQITVNEFKEKLKNEKEIFQNVDRSQIDEFLKFFEIDEEFLTRKLDSPKLAEPLIRESDFDALIKEKLEAIVSEIDLLKMLFEIVRPEIRRDGGDIEILTFKNRVLKFKLHGGCRGCYIADTVMIRYIEYLVRKYISDDILVENIKELVN